MNSLLRMPLPSSFFGALAAGVTHAYTLEGLVRPLLELLQVATAMESAYLVRLDESAGTVQVLYARNTHRLTIPEGLAVPWQDSLCKRALDDGLGYVDDARERWSDCEIVRRLGLAAFLNAPVRGKDGELFGVLCAASSERRSLPDAAPHVLALFAHLIGRQVERDHLSGALQQAHDALGRQALTDAVTQLPNRRAMLDEMQRRLAADAQQEAMIVALVDLDDCRSIHERLGPEAGDQFLQAVAKRLQRMLRDSDMVARMGHEQFVVLAVEQRAKADAAAAALSRRLESATRGPFKLDTELFDYAGASVGAVVAESRGEHPQGLLARADAAVELVKRARRLRAAVPDSVKMVIARYEWPAIE